MYTDKEFGFADLLVCYRDKYGVNAWEDERMWELAQNTVVLLVTCGRRVARLNISQKKMGGALHQSCMLGCPLAGCVVSIVGDLDCLLLFELSSAAAVLS